MSAKKEQATEEFRLVGGPYAGEYLTLPACTESTYIFTAKDSEGRKRKGRYVGFSTYPCKNEDERELKIAFNKAITHDIEMISSLPILYWEPK